MLLVLIVATALRVRRLDAYGLWIDEISSLQMSSAQPAGQIALPRNVIVTSQTNRTPIDRAARWTQIPTALRSDTHPPLYPLLLRLWREIFGDSDSSLRSLSLLCSIVAIVLLYDATRLLHRRDAAIWAAAIMAVAGAQIEFAQEARSYELLTMLLLAVVCAVARIEKLGPSPRRLVALSICTLLAALTHYLAIPAELAIGGYILLRFKGSERIRALGAMAIAGIFFLILCGPLLWAQRGNFSVNLQWLADDKPGLIGRTIERLATLPLQYFVTTFGTPGAAQWIGIVFYAMPLIAILRKDLLIWVLLAGAIIGTAAISDVVQHRAGLERLRMTVAAAPAFYAVIMAIATSLPRKWMVHAMGAIIVLCCILALPDAYRRPLKPQWRPFAAKFDSLASSQDVLVVPFGSQQENWEDALLLAGLQRYSAHPDRPVLVLSKPISAELLAQLRQAPTAWFLSASSPAPVDQFLPGAGAETSIWALNACTLMKLVLPPTPSTQ
jgi:uncharacterized membrane protein